MTKFSGDEMEIQLMFKKSATISMQDVAEMFEITFNDVALFISVKGNFVKQNLVLTKELPP